MVESMNKVHRVQRQMVQELEREPSIEELAARVHAFHARAEPIHAFHKSDENSVHSRAL